MPSAEPSAGSCAHKEPVVIPQPALFIGRALKPASGFGGVGRRAEGNARWRGCSLFRRSRRICWRVSRQGPMVKTMKASKPAVPSQLLHTRDRTVLILEDEAL